MDCGRCSKMMIAYHTFQDGHIASFFWCTLYEEPCHMAIKKCELRVLDEKMQDKAVKALKIDSMRKKLYDN